MSRQMLFNVFPSKTFIQIMYVYIVRNKKPCHAPLILNSYPILTNVCKPPKNFDFPGTEEYFRCIWFEDFPWVLYF